MNHKKPSKFEERREMGRKNNMAWHMVNIKKILTVLFVFLFYSFFYLYAQEKVDTREEARQQYREGGEFSPQDRYQEAPSEFEKAITLVTPPEMRLGEKIQEAQEKALVTPPGMRLGEKIQEAQEKVFAPAPALPEVTPSQKKLIEKKEEKKEEEVTEAVVTEIPEFETAEKEYYIDIGDVLDISVWRVEDLSKSEVIVRPDGKISFPLIGDIKAEGFTLTQLDDIMTEKLKAYVKQPQVSIMIRRFGEQANKVIVLGEIFGPGVYKFSTPPTIIEVVASAGGYTKHAVLNSIMVIRGDVRTKPEVARINLARILKGGRVKESIFLKPNDIVYVPRSFIGNINTFLEIFQPAINQYMQTLNARYLHNVVHRN